MTAVANAWAIAPDTTELGFLIHYPATSSVLLQYGSTESTNGPGPGPVLVIEALLPEPATAALLGLAGMAVAMRRRTRAS